jgi:hypothetical protein
MEKVRIQDIIYEIKSIKEHGSLLEIEFNTNIDLSNVDLTSIDVLTEGNVKCRSFNEYTTIYKTSDNLIILSNDGSIYVELAIIVPEIIETHIPTEEEIAILLAKADIERLKLELIKTDYKVIKCSEYQMSGLEAPYNIIELHTARQTLRDEINILESGLIN